MSNNISREEAGALFKVGRNRYDRLRNLNPTLPIPRPRPNYRVVTAEDKEVVRLFMKGQATEPGYPCQHRSIPVFMEDPSVTFVSLHRDYKIECIERDLRVLSYQTFIRIVKYCMPTLHLGRTKTDLCNSCFSLDLQIKNPETSEALRAELKAAKALHLDEAIVARRAINKIVKSVKDEVAPNDAPFSEEPVYIPLCFKDPFDRLNRPFVIDVEDGTLGELESADNAGLAAVYDFDYEDENTDEANPETEEQLGRKLKVTVEDFGSGIPLPHFGASQPNHDYYASNLTLNNMNFVDCASGQCSIFYYDERTAGKDGACVSSIRWREIQQFILKNKENPPSSECKVLDNCVGQNKSNTTHKFSMLCNLLVFPDGVTDIYFRVGHSHNQSDMKTAHAKKALTKKNLYTPQAVVKEVNKVKGLIGQLLDSRDGVFLDWKPFLDKHFPNMDVGFTSFFIFKFKDGVVHYQELGPDGEAITVKSKVFCADPVGTRQIILRELLNLNSTSNVVEICKAKVRLPPLPQRRISQKKIDNMKILYQQIPRDCRWFYPEGETVPDDTFVDLRARAVPHDQEPVAAQEPASQEASDVPEKVVSKVVSRRSAGRPRKLAVHESNQPAIHRFFSPVIGEDGDNVKNADRVDESDDEPVKRRKKRKLVIESDDSDDDSETFIDESLSILEDEEAANEDSLDRAPSSSKQPNSPLTQTNLLSPNMVSPLPDTSIAIDSNALKSLSDEELGRLGAQYSRQSAAAGGQQTRQHGPGLRHGGRQDVAGHGGDRGEFSLDINHNEGKRIVMTFRKRKEL